MENATLEGKDRTEDYPVETFRRLEAQLQAIRRRAMDLAAEKAAAAEPEGSYRVTEEHQDAALSELLSGSDQLLRLVGLRHGNADSGQR